MTLDTYSKQCNPSHRWLTGIAQELLDLNGEKLDVTSAQVQSICRTDLEHAARSGCLSASSILLGVMIACRDTLQADTQSIESANSIVRLISTRCRKISLELLSARLLIKYALSQSSISSSDTGGHGLKQLPLKDVDTIRTNSHVRLKIQRGEELHAEIRPFAKAFQDDCSIDRWAPKESVQIGVSEEQIVAAHPFMKVKRSDLWALSYATALRRVLCPRKTKKNTQADVEDSQKGKDTKPQAKSARLGHTAGASSSSSSAAGNVAAALSKLCDGDKSSIGWPLVVISALQPGGKGRPEKLESVKWFLWIGNYKYTMSFIELFLLDSNYDADSSGDSEQGDGLARLKCRLGQDAVDGAFLFNQHAEAVQRGSIVKVERILLPPSSICADPCHEAPRTTIDIDTIKVGKGGHRGGLDFVLATLPIKALHGITLFTATAEPHETQTQIKEKNSNPAGAREDAAKSKPAKRKQQNADGDGGSDGSVAKPQLALTDMVMHAAAELHGDVELAEGLSSDDEEQRDDDDAADITAAADKNNVSKIKAAVKANVCPPDQAISQVTAIISSWPQFADLNQHELEEQALILLVSGVSKQDEEITDVVSKATDDQKKAEAEADAGGPDKRPQDVMGPIDAQEAAELLEDASLPTSIAFVEKNATKVRGPASLPVGARL